jgi:choline dehydrogenase-like flavoprotein
MIYRKFEDIDTSNYPVVIFGSGPAGLTLALELENKKINSIIIEAGDEDFNDNSQNLYKSKFTLDELTETSVSRLRQLGGTSGHWGGWCKPFDDYDLKSWPININEINNYKDQTCQILEIKNQFRKSKINNSLEQIEFQYSKVRFAEKYKSYIKNSKNISLFLNTQLSHFNEDRGRIVNAVCISNDGGVKIINSKIFILAAGGIENSRILLWTKIQSKGSLNNNENIGKYWMTHSWILAGTGVLEEDKLINFMKNNYIGYEAPIHFASKLEFINKNQNISAAVYMDPEKNKKKYKEIIKDILCIAPNYGKELAGKVFGKSLKCGNIFMHIEDLANINNQISLDLNETDKFRIPIANINYKRSIDTVTTAKLFLKEFSEFCRVNSVGRIAMHENIYNLKDNIEYLGEYHHMGGTRMGENEKNSVVDKNLKVHKIENLYVAGSSVFPSCGYKNPTFTITQLSLRLGDFLKEQLTKV